MWRRRLFNAVNETHCACYVRIQVEGRAMLLLTRCSAGRHQRLELLLLLLDGFLHEFAGAEVVRWVQSRDEELVASRQISGSSLEAKLEAASGPASLRGCAVLCVHFVSVLRSLFALSFLPHLPRGWFFVRRFDPRSNADDRTTKDMVRAQDLDLERAKSEILRLAETGHGMYVVGLKIRWAVNARTSSGIHCY